jgi:hypothetical protein
MSGAMMLGNGNFMSFLGTVVCHSVACNLEKRAPRKGMQFRLASL